MTRNTGPQPRIVAERIEAAEAQIARARDNRFVPGTADREPLVEIKVPAGLTEVTGCCVWADPATDYDPVDPVTELCRVHYAEYEGLSLDGLDRMDAEQAADRL